MRIPPQRPGAMLLLTVLILGAVALTISMSIALRGIGELDMGFSDNQSIETLNIADGCAEEALLRLNRNSSYTGATVAIGDGSCDIIVSTISGSEKSISIIATLESWVRSIRIGVDLSDMSIREWVHE